MVIFIPRHRAPTTAANRVWSEFLALLDALPPGTRVVFLMHDIFGASYEEISRLVGLPARDCQRQVDLAHEVAHTRARAAVAVPARTP
ncbi:MAG TPA: sigma-70 region 4 domain-containing protein [Lysobacter sp.]